MTKLLVKPLAYQTRQENGAKIVLNQAVDLIDLIQWNVKPKSFTDLSAEELSKLALSKYGRDIGVLTRIV